jgi:hypothetical protein
MNGCIIPINNDSGGPFGKGGNRPPRNEPLRGPNSGLLRGGNNGPPRGGSNEYPTNKNPRPYTARPTGLWIGPTWNLWYPSWYSVQPPITPNPPSNRKSLPYPIYTTRTDLDAHVCVFQKVIQTNGGKNDVDIVNLICFTLHDAISEWG